MLRIVLKRVNEEAKIVELPIDKSNGFEVADTFKEILEAKYDALDKVCINRSSGLYLFVAELGEGANFELKSNNPHFPIQLVQGHALLTRYMVDEEGSSEYGDVGECELNIMNGLINNDDLVVAQNIIKSKENMTDREKELIMEALEVKRKLANILSGLGV